MKLGRSLLSLHVGMLRSLDIARRWRAFQIGGLSRVVEMGNYRSRGSSQCVAYDSMRLTRCLQLE
jgi:hypothetical protein